MTRQYNKRSSRGMRNLRSVGWSALKFTARTTDKAANNFAGWITTDHSGMSDAIKNMPSMGFLQSLGFVLTQFIICILGAVLQGIWIFLLIAYGIPFFLTGHF